jgi:hypothetical protein
MQNQDKMLGMSYFGAQVSAIESMASTEMNSQPGAMEARYKVAGDLSKSAADYRAKAAELKAQLPYEAPKPSIDKMILDIISVAQVKGDRELVAAVWWRPGTFSPAFLESDKKDYRFDNYGGVGASGVFLLPGEKRFLEEGSPTKNIFIGNYHLKAAGFDIIYRAEAQDERIKSYAQDSLKIKTPEGDVLIDNFTPNGEGRGTLDFVNDRSLVNPGTFSPKYQAVLTPIWSELQKDRLVSPK